MLLLGDLILSLIRNDPDESQGRYSNRISPAHGSIFIRQLMAFYEQYEKIVQFNSAVNSAGTNPEIKCGNSVIYNGLYIRAFKSGIENVVSTFQGILVHLEKEIFVKGKSIEQLSEFSSTPMVHLLHDMTDVCYKLNELINQIAEKNLKGCQILDLCVKYSYSGVPYLEDSLNRILESLHRAFLTQVKCFVMAGVLQDPINEFFIRSSFCVHTDAAKHVDATVSSSTSVSSLNNEIMSEIGLSTITQDSLTSQDCSYQLISMLIPCHVSYSLASNILHIGKLLKLLRKAPSNDQGISSLRDDKFGVNEVKIRKMFEDLESKSLVDIDKLDKVISDIWSILNEHLKKLADDVGDLLCQQKIITDIYLMQKGDLIRQFLIRSHHHMSSTTLSSMKGVLNSEFHNAAEDLYLTEFSKYTDHLSFTLPPKCTNKDEKIVNVLKLVYKVPWPLHMIFSEEIMNTYNLIFIYLIKLKLAHMKLVNSRRELHLYKMKGFFLSASILHSKLCHFFTNLENYIFVDVIHYEVNKWETSLNKLQDFDQIKIAHSLFLANVLYKLFLVKDTENGCEGRTLLYERKRTLIQEEIMGIVSLNDSFCLLVEGNPSEQEMVTLHKECEKRIIKLISLVRKISRELNSEHSQLLLLRLDYNCYYSSFILPSK